MGLQLQMMLVLARTSLHILRQRDERGSVVETVILTAVFAALAIAVGTIITLKVTDKAHSINLNN
jgi:hypothetical protein